MNNILIIDVETAGDFSNPLVYDIGYKIIDRAGKSTQQGASLLTKFLIIKF